MTTQDINPEIIASIREGAESVLVDTEEGWRIGVRSKGIYRMGACLGRMTITEDDQVFHSMVGSRPTFTRQEALDEIARLEDRAAEMDRELQRM